jgi:hypothetical protein
MVEDTKADEDQTIKVGANFVQTVRRNYEGYTKQEVLQAKAARQGQAMLGNPSEKDYQGLVSGNLINNCPIFSSNVSNAPAIFGPDLASVRKKQLGRNLLQWLRTMWQCLTRWWKLTKLSRWQQTYSL